MARTPARPENKAAASELAVPTSYHTIPAPAAAPCPTETSYIENALIRASPCRDNKEVATPPAFTRADRAVPIFKDLPDSTLAVVLQLDENVNCPRCRRMLALVKQVKGHGSDASLLYNAVHGQLRLHAGWDR